MIAWLWKNLVCRWLHPRCYPRDYDFWHCTKCHPCGECWDLFEMHDEYTADGGTKDFDQWHKAYSRWRI